MSSIIYLFVFILVFSIFIKMGLLTIKIYRLIYKLPEKLRYKIFYTNDNSFSLKYHFAHWKNLFDEEDTREDIVIKEEIKKIAIKAEKLFFLVIVGIITLILI